MRAAPTGNHTRRSKFPLIEQKIDIILGSDIYIWRYFTAWKQSLERSQRITCRSTHSIRLDHISGKNSNTTASSQTNKHMSTDKPLKYWAASALCQLANSFKNFGRLRKYPLKTEPTSDEAQCEAYFQKTHRRLINGRYEVHLPFISPILMYWPSAQLDRNVYLDCDGFKNA